MSSIYPPSAFSFVSIWLRIRFVCALRRGRLSISFEHRRCDFGIAWPVAAPLTCVGPIVVEASGIGPHHFPPFEEQKPQFVRWHPRDEDFRIVKSGSEPRHDSLR